MGRGVGGWGGFCRSEPGRGVAKRQGENIPPLFWSVVGSLFKALRRGIFWRTKRQKCNSDGRKSLWVYFKAKLVTSYFCFRRFFCKQSSWSLLGFFAHPPPSPSKEVLTTHFRRVSRGGFVELARFTLYFPTACKPASEPASQPASQPTSSPEMR